MPDIADDVDREIAVMEKEPEFSKEMRSLFKSYAQVINGMLFVTL